MKNALSLLVLSFFHFGIFAQVPTYMKRVSGGTATMGGGYQYEVKGFRMFSLMPDSAFTANGQGNPAIGEVPTENNPDLRMTVSDFYIAETEVSNGQYLTFLIHSLMKEDAAQFEKEMKVASREGNEGRMKFLEPLLVKAGAANLLPDTTCWRKDFPSAYLDPFIKYYFSHPAFEDYPVVGVSWEQANEYCKWLTADVNAQLGKKHKDILPEFRLPTEMEWEYAAKAGGSYSDASRATNYPWVGNELIDQQGRWQANVKTGPGNYIGDGYEVTAAVGSFSPNAIGLHHMGGNVAEWTQDVFVLRQFEPASPEAGRQLPVFIGTASDDCRVVKGGSWADYHWAAMCGSRAKYVAANGYSRVGFRVAMSIKGESE